MAAWSGDSSSARGSVAAATATRATPAPKNRELRRRLPELGSWFWGGTGDVESPNRTAKCVQSGGAGRQGMAFVVTEDPIPPEVGWTSNAPLPVPVVTPPLGQPIEDTSPPNCPS